MLHRIYVKNDAADQFLVDSQGFTASSAILGEIWYIRI